MKRLLIFSHIVLFSFFLSLLQAEEIYISQEDYLKKAFAQDIPPKPFVIWIKSDVKETVTEILGHPYHQLRLKYWEKAGKTVWILNEIGKEKYITTGITINTQAQIENVTVLAFRESRGWEVKHDFFTQQFIKIMKQKDTQLNQPIDGITGATLSVNALKVQTRMALYLHEKTRTSSH